MANPEMKLVTQLMVLVSRASLGERSTVHSRHPMPHLLPEPRTGYAMAASNATPPPQFPCHHRDPGAPAGQDVQVQETD